jgi:4'-phosphopantetheinyl transferase EntD
MITSLLPRDVTVVTATEAMAHAPLHPLEAKQTSRMAAKRLREFTLARACAREGLEALGIRDFPLLNAADRAPIWPDGIVGSVTHCSELCAVALARMGEVTSLGIDAEALRELSPDVVNRITSEDERARLANLPPCPHVGGWGLLVFSAKEAFYKCYYPLGRTFLGFRDAELDLDLESESFRVRLTRDDAPSAAGARSFEGRFGIGPTCLATAVTL